MAWKDIPDDGGRSEKIPNGIFDMRFTRVLAGKKDGTKFVSSKGDKQIMLIATDTQDREAAVMVTLSAAAAWKLKSYLVAVGADLDAMDADGVDWNAFADELFATKQLVDRPFRGEVKWEKSDTNGKDYADITPLRPAPGHVPAAAPGDDIPI